jgi:hypothetical protein
MSTKGIERHFLIEDKKTEFQRDYLTCPESQGREGFALELGDLGLVAEPHPTVLHG